MGPLTVVFLLAFLAEASTGQAQNAPEESPQVVVVKNKWTARHFRPDPAAFDDSLNRSRVHREPNSIPDSIRAMQDESKSETSSAAVDGYVYSATVKNVGPKTVTRIGWDYMTADAEGGNTTHHYFDSRMKIPPGKQKTLSKFARVPPASTVDVTRGSTKMIEQVIIHYVEYEDGSFWRRE